MSVLEPRVAPNYPFPDPGVGYLVKKGRGEVYRTPEGDFPRVTSILNCLPKQRFLVPWAADQERVACLEAARLVASDSNWFDYASALDPAEMEREKIEDFRAWLGDSLVSAMEAKLGPAREHQKIKDRAADIGSEIHNEIERLTKILLGQPAAPEVSLSEPATLAVMAWQDWLLGSGFRIVRAEQVVWSADLGIAGTVDAFAVNALGELGIIDYKTSKSIYDEYHVQVATYSHAARELGLPVKWQKIVRIPKTLEDPIFKTDAPIESKSLGEMYRDTRTEEELIRIFRAAKTIHELL